MFNIFSMWYAEIDMNATLAQQSLEADVFAGMEPMFMEPLWSMAQASIVHFIWLMYARGPRIVGRFFFSGRAYSDMCSDINHTVPSSHWSQSEATYRTCVAIIRRDFESWVTCVYVLTLFYMCIWGIKTLITAVLSQPLNHAWERLAAAAGSNHKFAVHKAVATTPIAADDNMGPMWADVIQHKSSPPAAAVVVVSATTTGGGSGSSDSNASESQAAPTEWAGVTAFQGNRMRRISRR